MVFPQKTTFKNKIALKLKLTNLKKAQFKEITLLQIQKLFVTQIQAKVELISKPTPTQTFNLFPSNI